jgi:hypothetical protein
MVAASVPEAVAETLDVTRYDANGNGRIDPSEYQQAVRDNGAGKIAYAEILAVTIAALQG